ncbi:hypothetical protein KST83_05485 [Fusobacterium nucleatum]|uniref:Uncharacterized protein n=1 Tax=Fusobacterium nucleatum subsp. polymorphum TaxID=76857 RepID=A0A2C6AZ05_FUSNP|nr:hypothetical protein [Fusobacterium polymorphum]PHH97506.1 hypothetical protein CA840_09495 [Fusobacterium polymorphum]
MKLKHKTFDKVSVYCNGEVYNFVNGEIEVDDIVAKELLKNPAIEEIKVEKVANIEEENQENVEEHDEKKKGSKK